MYRPQQPSSPKLSVAAANEMRRLRARGATLGALARRFGVSRAAAHSVVRYRSYAPEGALVVVLSQDALALLAALAPVSQGVDAKLPEPC